jgi:multiple sugar transport system permease protein
VTRALTDPIQAVPADTELAATITRREPNRLWAGRNRYLLGAVCIVICLVMVAPIVLSVSASLKTTLEAAAVPPTYFPSALSMDNYEKLWDYGSGLLTYLGNSLITAALTIVMILALTVPAVTG